MAVVAVIQARMGSTRLPGKVLADLGGRPVLDWVIAAAVAIPGVDRLVVATSTAAADDAIASSCRSRGVTVFRGREDDVLDRFLGAARFAAADVVVRVTADCPFLDPVEAGKVLTPVLDGTADYATNADPPTYPDGLDCEAFTRAALERTAGSATRPSEREHVTPYMRDPANGFRIARITCPLQALDGERWTLDVPADLAFLRAVAERLPRGEPPAYRDILRILRAAPHLQRVDTGEARNAGYARSLLRNETSRGPRA